MSPSTNGHAVRTNTPEIANGRRRNVPLEAEERVCGAILVDPSTYVAVFDLVNWKHFGGPKTRSIARAIWECVEQRLELTRTNVIAKLTEYDRWCIDGAEGIDARYLVMLEDSAYANEIVAAPQYAERIRRYAISRWRAKATRDYLEQLESMPDDSDSLTEDYVRRMSDSRRPQSVHGSSTRDIRSGRSAQHADATHGIPCGLRLFDRIVGGYKPSRIWGIVARFKGRKTTLARFLALHSARNGIPTSFLMSADGTKEDLYNGFVAMLATSYMRANGVPDTEWRIKAEGLERSLRTPAQHTAIEWAEDQLDNLPLYLYDTSNGIRDTAEAERILRSDIEMRGVGLYVYDYIQNSKRKHLRGKPYEAYEDAIETYDTLTREKQVTGIWLSQMNQGSIASAQLARRTGDDPDTDDVLGPKWGPKFQEACDHYFVLRYDELRSPHKLRVFHRLSRWSAPFDVEYTIEVNSGLFLNPSLIPVGFVEEHP